MPKGKCRSAGPHASRRTGRNQDRSAVGVEVRNDIARNSRGSPPGVKKEIAEAAGISRHGLYLYFKTKEEVYRAAVEPRAERLVDEIRQGIGKKATVEEKASIRV